MPAQRPRAAFEPLPPDFDVRELVENTPNFQYVDRISYDTIEEQGIDLFEKLVLLHVIINGKPLVIDGFDERLDPNVFSVKWLKANHGRTQESARDLAEGKPLPLSVGHYLDNMELLTEQFFENKSNYKDKKRQRVYLKDVDCPQGWIQKLEPHIPPFLFYLNESTGQIGGPGAVEDHTAGHHQGKGIAIAGDLMSSLPENMRAENLMCYIGHEGTYTPAHREMCASLGHNIMVEASSTVDDDGKLERPGSSIWFMTEANDRHLVAEWWLATLGHDIEVENHFAQVNAWKNTPFTTYVVEQKPGDFILIPPMAPHQVWNRGTRTMKVAWNRTTTETLEFAFKEAIPNSRMVCRDEQYKNKSIVYYTLQKYSHLLKVAKRLSESSPQLAHQIRTSKKVRDVQKHFIRLFALYKDIMLSEMFNPDDKKRQECEFLEFDSNVTCAYCRGNIFNRFLTCKSCVRALGTDEDEPYDVCMDCFAMGRGCFCQSNLQWVEQWQPQFLEHNYEEWRNQILEIDHKVSSAVQKPIPKPLSEERKSLTKKTLAQICQEQLKLRPWVDYTKPRKPQEEELSEEEIEVDDNGTIKKTKKKKPKSWYNKNRTCHVCCHRQPSWKMTGCKTCSRWYCYGSLYRAHDILPQMVMEDPAWSCPHCKKVCNTGKCRQDPNQISYEPKGTLLGHDTKKVADARSYESLVDFGKSNLSWIRDEDLPPTQSSRFARRAEEAARARQFAENIAAAEDGDLIMDGSFNPMSYEDDITYSPPPFDPDVQSPEMGAEVNHLLDPALRDAGGASSQLESGSINHTTSQGSATGFNPINGQSSQTPQQSNSRKRGPQSEKSKLAGTPRPKKRKSTANFSAELTESGSPKQNNRGQGKKKGADGDDSAGYRGRIRNSRAKDKESQNEAPETADGGEAVDTTPKASRPKRNRRSVPSYAEDRPVSPIPGSTTGEPSSSSDLFVGNGQSNEDFNIDNVINEATQMLDQMPYNDGFSYAGTVEMAETAIAMLGQPESSKSRYQAV